MVGAFRLRRSVAAAIALSTAWSQDAAGAVTPAELAEVSDIGGLAADPEGKTVAFRVERARIDSNGYVSDWFVAEPGAGLVRRLGGGGAPIHVDPGVSPVERPVWSADGSFLLFRALVDGAVEIWRAPVDGSGARRMLRDEADVIDFELVPEGNGIVYRVGATRAEIRRAEVAEYDAGIRLDASVDLAQSTFRGAIINGRHASQRLVGRWFERGPLLWRRPLVTEEFDFATGETMPASVALDRRLAGGAERIGDGLVALSAEGLEAKVREANGISSIEVRRPGREAEPLVCDAPQCRSERIDWLAWQPGGEGIVFATRNPAQRHSIHLWSIGSGRVRTIVRGDGLLSGSREPWTPCAIADRAAVCVATGPLSPPQLEAIDLETGVRRVLHDPNRLLRERLALRVEHLTWSAGAGHRFTGVLLVPSDPDPAPLPLFVTYYNCDGFLRGGVGDEWPLASMAARGIAALCINRTSTGDLGSAAKDNDAALSGVAAIIDQLAGRRLVDRDRVGMGGLSFGAGVALWTAFRSSLLAAVSVASPTLEPSYFWYNGFRGRDAHERVKRWWGLGDPAETRPDWKRMSPALNVDRIDAAVLMQLPEQEARLATELIGRLSRSDTPAEFYVFPDEPHIKVQPRHKLAVYERNLDWFRYWLQGYRDPDTAKLEQYKRWDAMARRAEGSSLP